ncbi:MAG: alpha/beta fold hydrolase [Bacteroidetes bacterium]|nr:alpha/beta fold hydrolase [Bacteroidota bacterium]
MPLIHSSYYAPTWLRNGHIQSILPSLFRRVHGVNYVRERVDTPDGDFLDLDWSCVNSRRVVIICHGLEGSSDRPYMRGMAMAFNHAGWDALAWNYRGCSGEPNRLVRSYHSGETGDLNYVVQHALKKYHRMALIGFSLGGNLVLKYTGERRVPTAIGSVVAVSAPCDLRASAVRMEGWEDRIYMRRFLRMLGEKLTEKQKYFPNAIDLRGYNRIRTFREFDDRFTAPMHGFRDAEDYWERCSSKSYLSSISVSTLILSAEDDPFLTPECFPTDVAIENERIHLELTTHGGHVGFIETKDDGQYYSERRAVEFINEAERSVAGDGL